MHRVAVLLVAFLVTAPAMAQSNDVFFKDYLGLTKLLRSKGVEPVGINWTPLEAACLGLKSETDQVSYNRCLYQHALDQADYASDRNACNARARSQYPDELTGTDPRLRIIKNDTQTYIYQQPLSDTDLKAKRDDEFNLCMDSKGWRDASGPGRGRTNANY